MSYTSIQQKLKEKRSKRSLVTDRQTQVYHNTPYKHGRIKLKFITKKYIQNKTLIQLK